MRSHEAIIPKPTKKTNNNLTSDAPVKPSMIAKIRDFFHRSMICRSIVSENELRFRRSVCCDDGKKSDENYVSDDEDEEEDEDSKFGYNDVPPGHFGVLVGVTDQEVTRFVMPIKFLTLPPFEVMLRKSYDTYGLIKDGPLRLLTEPNTFRYILQCSLAQYEGDVSVPMPHHPCSDSCSDDESRLGLGENCDHKISVR